MASSDVWQGGLQGGIAGASTGAKAGSAGGPWGTAIGAIAGGVIGTVGGAILGRRKKKPKIPNFASSNVFGYDTYGNLVSKGSFKRDPVTGEYVLSAGELSPQEKAMRRNLAGNIEGLINTVGSTPDAFVRYAKELSDSYYKQGERQLSENVAKEQARLDESLARRGLSTSRAAADIQGELERRRQSTLADIYDTSKRYGYNVQSGLQNQAQNALGKLAGYQGQLAGIDQSYLSQALTAQQIGQQYENMKTGMQNQQIAAENQGWQNVLDTLTSAGMSLSANSGGGASSGGQAYQSLGGTNYLSSYYNPLNYNNFNQVPAFNYTGGSTPIYADQNYWAGLGA